MRHVLCSNCRLVSTATAEASQSRQDRLQSSPRVYHVLDLMTKSCANISRMQPGDASCNETAPHRGAKAVAEFTIFTALCFHSFKRSGGKQDIWGNLRVHVQLPG